MRGDYLSIRVSILLAAAVGLMATPALALVQHPNTSTVLDNEEPPVMSDRPNNAVVGWWNYNASAVAIKPNHILTTCHQGYGVGTTVSFGGTTYKVAEVFQHGKADLRIARITTMGGADANLANYVGYYKDTNEEDKTAVVGGFGRGRGTIYPTYYTWAVSDNKTQRWGQNKLDGQDTLIDPAAFVTDVLTAHFENRGDPNWVEYEAAVAEYDSGGGWFLKDSVTGSWQVAGLSRGADNPSSFNPAAYMDCVRVSSYATWLNNAFSPSKWNSSLGGDWSIAGNWSGGVPTGLDKWAVFSDKVPDSRMVTLDAGHAIGTLRFDCLGSLTIAAGGSNKLTFQVTNKVDGSSADAAQIETGNTNGNGALTITAPVTMNTPLVVRHNSGGTMTISGEVTGTGNSLTKAGTGTLVLSGANTYTGATTVFAGMLQFAKRVSLYNNNTAKWTPANLVVASGATAAFNVGGTEGFTPANIDTLKTLGTSTGGFKSGAILGLDTASGDFSYSRAIANPNGGANILGLTKLGANTLTLSGASTYTGKTTVSAGILKAGIASVANVSGAFGNNSAVTLANTAGVSIDITGYNTQIGSLAGGGATGGNVTLGAATLTVGGNNTSTTYAGVLGLGGTSGALAKIGSGTLTLSGANTYTGATTVSAGTLQFAKQVSLYNNIPASWTAANLVVASGATAAFNVGGTGEFTAENIDTLKVLGTSTGGFKSGAILGLSTANAAGGNFPYPNAIGNPNGGANILGLTKLGANTLTLSGANTYTGTTTVSAGTLQAAKVAALPNQTTPGFATVANTATLRLNVGGPGEFAAADITNVLTNATFASATAILGIDATSGDFPYSPAITKTLALTKFGTGALTLSGANTFGGGVTLSAGTLNLGSTTALGATAGTFTISGGTLDSTVASLVNANANPIIINGDFAFAGTNGLDLGTGAVSLGAAAGTSRTITVNAGNLTFGGTISNGTTATTLVKAGIGTLTTAAITAGTVNHNAGTLHAASVTSTNFNVYSTANVTGAVTLTGTATVGNGMDAATLTAGAVMADSLAIRDQAIVTTSGTSKVNVLTFDGDTVTPFGQWDITKGGAVLDGNNVDPYTSLPQLIAAGYNGGDWAGQGLTSSIAAYDPGTFAVGYADNGALSTSYNDTDNLFRGVAVDPNAYVAVVGLTILGDLDLNGKCDIDDAMAFFQNYGVTEGAYWWQGDIYGQDGQVNIDDAMAFFQFYNTTLEEALAGYGLGEVNGLDSGLGSGLSSGLGAVPEPATMGLMILGAVAMLARRRRAAK
jgi:autotransporter-associated beta strand protein